DSTEIVLFLPPRDRGQERWTGVRLGPDGDQAASLSGISAVLSTDSLDRRLRYALIRTRAPLYVPLDNTTKNDDRIRELTFDARDVRNLRPVVDSMRLVKDGDELARLRVARSRRAHGHLAAMRAGRPGAYGDEGEAGLGG